MNKNSRMKDRIDLLGSDTGFGETRTGVLIRRIK